MGDKDRDVHWRSGRMVLGATGESTDALDPSKVPEEDPRTGGGTGSTIRRTTGSPAHPMGYEFMMYMLTNMGKISHAEVEEVEALFRKYDVDGNGMIDVDDLLGDVGDKDRDVHWRSGRMVLGATG